ncbi:Hypp2644 [Branchiostoma lanceolatum]|uniref:Hypp2644 protein n=1 Tax=Branchiostoma lanceolatum TaxID=7740 RepID=A0A8J9ZY19_BRALA|nr:Hypp2644 [Branchiostoma lanceolatum]
MDDKATCANKTWIIVWRSCTRRRPHSLVRRPSLPSGRTMSRRLETESDAVDDHDFLLCLITPYVLHSTSLGFAFMPVGSACDFIRAFHRSPVFTCWDRHIRGSPGGLRPARLPSPGLARLPKRLPGVWPLRMLQLLGATGES